MGELFMGRPISMICLHFKIHDLENKVKTTISTIKHKVFLHHKYKKHILINPCSWRIDIEIRFYNVQTAKESIEKLSTKTKEVSVDVL